MDSGSEIDEEIDFRVQTPNQESIIETLKDEIDTGEYEFLNILAATISNSGFYEFEDDLQEFCESGGKLNVCVGLSMNPDATAIRQLREMSGEYPGQVCIKLLKMEDGTNLFHPKLYWLCGNNSNFVINGSPNWSKRGFEENIEAWTVYQSHSPEGKVPEYIRSLSESLGFIEKLESGEATWGTLLSPTDNIIDQLEESGREETTTARTQSTSSTIEIEDEMQRQLWPLEYDNPILVMELLKESRYSQIQPPQTVWENFFNEDTDLFTEEKADNVEISYSLTNVRTGETEIRDVVVHDHQATVEIPEAKDRDHPDEQSAFIVFKKRNEDQFDYQLYLEGRDDELEDIEDFMESEAERPGHAQKLVFISM